MLTWIAVTAGCLALLPLAVASPAQAIGGPDGDVTCPPNAPVCVITVKDPGTAGHTGKNAGHRTATPNATCSIPKGRLDGGDPMPCHDPDFGWWSNADGCYYQLSKPQPPTSSPLWGGHTTGAIYDSTCYGYIGTGGGSVWRATPPPGLAGPVVTPAELAQDAVKLLRIRGPAIGMAPDPAKSGLVGLPVWMWTARTGATWGPVSATATVPGLSVTATAKAERIRWAMGDGHSVSCTTPGTPYSSSAGASSSPDCGYVYTASSASKPGAEYRVTATTTWDITWAGGGQTGQLTTTLASTTTARIGELQVLVS